MLLRFCLVLACLVALGLALSVTTEKNSVAVDSAESQEETDSYEQDDDDYDPYMPYGYFDPRTDGFPNIS